MPAEQQPYIEIPPDKQAELHEIIKHLHRPIQFLQEVELLINYHYQQILSSRPKAGKSRSIRRTRLKRIIHYSQKLYNEVSSECWSHDPNRCIDFALFSDFDPILDKDLENYKAFLLNGLPRFADKLQVFLDKDKPRAGKPPEHMQSFADWLAILFTGTLQARPPRKTISEKNVFFSVLKVALSCYPEGVYCYEEDLIKNLTIWEPNHPWCHIIYDEIYCFAADQSPLNSLDWSRD